jgi:Ca2+:H+ antiporter
MTLNLLLLFIPLSLGLHYLLQANPVWVFITSILAIVPLAVWIRRSTEQLAHRLGPSVGGLLNVTFGNAAEFILMLFILFAGKEAVVKGQITGSIIGNSLLGLGLAAVVGTWDRERLKFNRKRAGLLSTLLILVVIGLLLPALFDYTERDLVSSSSAHLLDEKLSLWVSIILIGLYIANLIYTLVTHRDVFAVEDRSGPGAGDQGKEPLWKGLAVLGAATVLTAVEAEMVSSALEMTSASLGISVFFLGVTVLAVIGNAAEYVAAIYFAHNDEMDMVVTITVGSSIQVALLVAPLLVLVSYLLGNPMNLVFANPLEIISIAGVAFGVNTIAEDGEITWFEGVLLLGLYILLAIAFFYVTPPGN